VTEQKPPRQDRDVKPDPDQTQRIGSVKHAADRHLNRWPTVDRDKNQGKK